MPSYPVFASYAQADRERHLERFIEELREELRVREGGEEAVAFVFFDRDGVSAGDMWSQKVLEAVNTAEVLVCLMSPTFLNREWCGRELEVFVRRHQRLPDTVKNARFIFPVWWQVLPTSRPLPSKLARFQHRDADYPRDYEGMGVRGLLRRNLVVQFRKMVDRLAELICQELAKPVRLPVGEGVQDLSQIQNAFDEEQPYDVRMVVMATGGDAWKPSAVDMTVAEASVHVARRLQIFCRKIATGDNLAEAIRRAQNERQVIIVVVDAAGIPDVSINVIDDLRLQNLALLLVDSRELPQRDIWLRSCSPTGTFVIAQQAGLMRIAGPGDMCGLMEELVDEARRRLQSCAPVTKVEDPQLRMGALAQGIEPNLQPNLTGPGGEVQG